MSVVAVRPKMRPVQLIPASRSGRPLCLVRDPWALSADRLLCPLPLVPALALCDGHHTAADIVAALRAQGHDRVTPHAVDGLLQRLDALCLLDNERAQPPIRRALADYRAQPVRPLRPGTAYAADPAVLGAQFAAWLDAPPPSAEPWRGRALLSPHIDYDRGGPVYGAVWGRAAAQAQDAELIIILATDHAGWPGSVTLTRLPYATPFGVLPTAPALIDALADALGPELFALELNHRHEHAVELPANWLAYVRRDAPPVPVLPLLCGPFEPYFDAPPYHPAADARLTTLIATLQRLTAGRRVLVVASADLAHVGPAFRSETVTGAALADADRPVRAALAAGDAEAFYAAIAATRNRYQICGLAPLYLLLRFLGATRGHEVAYDHCSADSAGRSFVSVSGTLLA